MSFPELPRLVQSLTAIWTLVVLLMFIYNLVRFLQLKRSPGLTALTGVLLAAAMYLYQALCYGLQISAWQVPLVPAWFGFLMARPALVFGLLAVLTAVAAVQQYRLGKWIRTHLSVMSVKEAFDRLPTGMSFSRENGRPLLVNTEMERIQRLADDGKCLIVRPDAMPVSSLTLDTNKLDASFYMGRAQALRALPQWEEFLFG